MTMMALTRTNSSLFSNQHYTIAQVLLLTSRLDIVESEKTKIIKYDDSAIMAIPDMVI